MSSEYLKNWIPIESNPETMTKLMHGFGVDSSWQFHDCFGLDDDCLSFVPQPCLAVILLFPSNNEKREDKDPENIEQFKDIFFMKQLVNNACGTIAVVHAVANNADKLNFNENAPFKEFLEKTMNQDFNERGKTFSDFDQFEAVHNEISVQGQTEAPKEGESVDYHFICYISHKDTIYELDGMKASPIPHGKTSSETFLKDCAEIIKRDYIEKSNGNINFSIITLGPSQQD